MFSGELELKKVRPRRFLFWELPPKPGTYYDKPYCYRLNEIDLQRPIMVIGTTGEKYSGEECVIST